MPLVGFEPTIPASKPDKTVHASEHSATLTGVSPTIYEYSSSLSIYDSTALLGHGHFFSSLLYTQLVGLLGHGVRASQGRYLHTGQHKNTK
jgi:hypothetical protein